MDNRSQKIIMVLMVIFGAVLAFSTVIQAYLAIKRFQLDVPSSARSTSAHDAEGHPAENGRAGHGAWPRRSGLFF